MEIKQNVISRTSYIQFPNIYRVDDEIYDEIVIKNNKYVIIRRCAIEDYDKSKSYGRHVTDFKKVIYELPSGLYHEEEIDEDLIKTYPEFTQLSISNGVYVSSQCTINVDYAHKEYIEQPYGSNITIDTENFDETRPSYLYKIKNELQHNLIAEDSVRQKTSFTNVIISGESILGENYINITDGRVSSPSFQTPLKIDEIGHKVEDGDYYDFSFVDTSDQDCHYNSWYVEKYESCGHDLSSIQGKELIGTTYLPSNKFVARRNGLTGDIDGAYTIYLRQYTYCSESYTVGWQSSTFWTYNGIASVYVNGTCIISNTSTNTNYFSFTYRKGLNIVEVVFEQPRQSSTVDSGFRCDELYARSTNGSPNDNIMYMYAQKKSNVYDYFFTVKSPENLIVNIYNQDSDTIHFDYNSSKWVCDKKYDCINISDGMITSANIDNGKSCIYINTETNMVSDSAWHEFFVKDSYITENSLNSNYTISCNSEGLVTITVLTSELEAIIAALNNTKIYYEKQTHESLDIINQIELFNFSDKLNENSSAQDIYIYGMNYRGLVEYSVDESYTCLTNAFPIKINNSQTYTFTRPTSGDILQFKYYDKDFNIIGYSEYLSSSETTFTITPINNVAYINFMDGVISNNHNHSLITNETFSVENTEISTLELTINDVLQQIDLPHSLNSGDELVYDVDEKSWYYYPISLDDDYIKYSEEDFPAIQITSEINSIGCQNYFSIELAISKKQVRSIQRAKIIDYKCEPNSGENGYGYVSWKDNIGSTEYEIYIGDTLIQRVDNENLDIYTYHFLEEQDGLLYIKSIDYNSSAKNSYNTRIKTIPNTPILNNVDTLYENNRYYVTVQFYINSQIADNYHIAYSLDGSSNINVDIANTYEFGDLVEYSFTSPSISSSFDIKINSSNDIGLNSYSDNVHLVTNDGFSNWTYKTTLNQMLLAWIDQFPDEDGYKIKYKIEGEDEWRFLVSGSSIGTGRRAIEYIPLAPNKEMRVCLAVIRDGQTNIYTRPITISKALDTTLIPPANFSGVREELGKLQFTWDDLYDVEANFELNFTYSDGTTQIINIPREASSTDRYMYVYDADTYGFATARVKMKWELGESEYSDSITVYNIPVVEFAPELYHQKHENNQLVIQWETYEFIKHYTLYFTIDGVQYVINTQNTTYEWDIPSDRQRISINAAIKATFIDDTYTSISSSIAFSVCNTNNIINSTIYTHNEKNNNMVTTIMTRDLDTLYNLYANSISKCNYRYPLYEKNIKEFIFIDNKLEESFWGHEIGESYKFITNQSSSVNIVYDFYSRIYEKVFTDNTLETIIKRTIEKFYPFYVEIDKITIACLGDSITAGHPNYWAETGTGIIESQYEYWLSRRLKGEFNVINCGYGQEKSADMLERFDRDIVSIKPRYVIILGGTNDYIYELNTHKVYIVRCRRKLCNVCL